VNTVCKYLAEGVVTTVTDPLPCISGGSWRFIAAATPTQEGEVACSVVNDPAKTSKLVFQGGSVQNCSTAAKTVTYTAHVVGNWCNRQVNLSAGEWTATTVLELPTRCMSFPELLLVLFSALDASCISIYE
jgi:hypothetical protein